MKLPQFGDKQYMSAPKIFATDRLISTLFLWAIPDTITPNHITLFRMIATPATICLLAVKNYEWGVPLFLLVALTDALDGALARTRNKITQWGMMFDPLADKLLIFPTLLILMFSNLSPVLALTIIVIELLIIFLALFWRKQGRVVEANVWGKIKMVLEVCGIFLILLAVWLALPLLGIASFLLVASILFAIISTLRYGV